MADIPQGSDIDLSVTSTSQAVRNVLDAKYSDAGAWAQWAAKMLEEDIANISNLLGKDIVGTDLANLTAALNTIALYTPPGTFSYTAPTGPVYDTVPAFASQTIGALLAIPAVEAITIGAAPSTAITFDNPDFSDTLLSSLRNKLSADLTAGSTGLGDAEAALFARETARQNAARALAYTEITTVFSARGFDMPPGGIAAKQTEANNESGIRLSDSSAAIMAESAKLAQSWNQTTVTACTQIVDVLARVFDSKIIRNFEAAKNAVILSLEGFKQEVSVALAKADLNKTAIASTVAANDATVKVFQAEIEGQIAPIQAIAGANNAKASAYGAAVQASVASLNAQVIPEELKLKGAGINAQIAGAKADIAAKEADLSIGTAARQLALEVETIRGLAQGAQQIISGALNGVSVSTSFGYGGSGAFHMSDDKSTNVSYRAPDGKLPLGTATN